MAKLLSIPLVKNLQNIIYEANNKGYTKNFIYNTLKERKKLCFKTGLYYLVNDEIKG